MKSLCLGVFSALNYKAGDFLAKLQEKKLEKKETNQRENNSENIVHAKGGVLCEGRVSAL